MRNIAQAYHIVQGIDGAHTRHIGYAATFRAAIQVAIDWHAANEWPHSEIYGPEATHSQGNAYYWRHLAEFIDLQPTRRFTVTTSYQALVGPMDDSDPSGPMTRQFFDRLLDAEAFYRQEADNLDVGVVTLWDGCQKLQEATA